MTEIMVEEDEILIKKVTFHLGLEGWSVVAQDKDEL